jgi:hypothetical protein
MSILSNIIIIKCFLGRFVDRLHVSTIGDNESVRLLLSALTLLTFALAGAAQTPTGFAKRVGPVPKIEKPELKGSVKFKVANEAGDQTGQISLEKGTTPGVDPLLFVGAKGAFVSVHIELVGDSAKSVFTGRANHPAEPGMHLFSAGLWIGDYTEHMLSDNRRMGRLYDLYSPKVVYSMMISWPPKDPVAKKDAERLARSVIWSFKLNT